MAYNRHRSIIAVSLTQKLGEFQKQQHYTDVIVNVQSKTYPCHKLILAASSPFFDKMFSSNFKESNEGQVTLEEVSSGIFENILSYLYNAKDSVNSKNVLDMLKAACMLQIQSIQERCENFLIAHLCVNNCLSVWKFARIHFCEKLSNRSYKYILNHFSLMVKTETFLNIEKEELIKIIENNRLGVVEEDVVARAVSEWVKFDETRHHGLEDILQHVRFPLMTLEQIYHIQKTELPVVEKIPECMKILDKAKQYLTLPYTRHTFASIRCTHRAAMDKVMVFPVNVKIASSVTSILLYDPIRSAWWSTKMNLNQFIGLIAVKNEMCLVAKTSDYRRQVAAIYEMNLSIPRRDEKATNETIPNIPHSISKTTIDIPDMKNGIAHSLGKIVYIITSGENEENIFMCKWDESGVKKVVSIKTTEKLFTVSPAKVQALATINSSLYIFGHQFETHDTVIQRLCFQDGSISLKEVGLIPGKPSTFQAITQDSAIILICSGGDVFRLTEDAKQHLKVDRIFQIEGLDAKFSSGIYQGSLYIATLDKKLRKFDLSSGHLFETVPIPCDDLTFGLCGMYPVSKAQTE